MTVREVHGVAGARKGVDNMKTNVRVVDGITPGEIFLALSDDVHVVIDAEQARFTAKCLYAAALRATRKEPESK